MSAYEIKLRYQSEGVSAHARLAVRDPLWPEGEMLDITPDCVIPSELKYWGERAKAEIDRAVANGTRRIEKLHASSREASV